MTGNAFPPSKGWTATKPHAEAYSKILVSLGAAAVAYMLLWAWSDNLWSLLAEESRNHRADMAAFRAEMQASREHETKMRSRTDALIRDVQKSLADTLRVNQEAMRLVGELVIEVRKMKAAGQGTSAAKPGVSGLALRSADSSNAILDDFGAI